MTRLVFVFGLLSLGFSANLQAELFYGFDDGTFEGWEMLNYEGAPFPVDESAVTWISSDEAIDIGDGFELLPATSGDFRIVPEPFANRDCIGATCLTQILRSPEFMLDGSGDLSIDMIGGAALSNQPFDPDVHLAPESPEDLFEFKDGGGLQGFALRDVESDEYVLHGFSSFENDGKARDTDPETREFWDTVTLSKEDLAPYANNGRSYQVDVFDSYSGGWGWIGFDSVSIPAGGAPGTAGDFDNDGDVDADDIDSIATEIRDGGMGNQFDLNADGSVNADDRSFLISSIMNTYIGDSNVDGEFNSSDFVAVFQAGEYEDGVAANSKWATGDWNGDLEFDSSDFVLAFQDGGFELGPRAAAASVPEPSALALASLAALTIVGSRRRS